MPSGGARKNAGRKPGNAWKKGGYVKSRRIGVFLKLEPEYNEWLAQKAAEWGTTKSDLMNAAIKSAIEAGKGK